MYYFLRCGEHTPVLEAYIIFFIDQKLLGTYVNKNNNLAELQHIKVIEVTKFQIRLNDYRQLKRQPRGIIKLSMRMYERRRARSLRSSLATSRTAYTPPTVGPRPNLPPSTRKHTLNPLTYSSKSNGKRELLKHFRNDGPSATCRVLYIFAQTTDILNLIQVD